MSEKNENVKITIEMPVVTFNEANKNGRIYKKLTDMLKNNEFGEINHPNYFYSGSTSNIQNTIKPHIPEEMSALKKEVNTPKDRHFKEVIKDGVVTAYRHYYWKGPNLHNRIIPLELKEAFLKRFDKDLIHTDEKEVDDFLDKGIKLTNLSLQKDDILKFAEFAQKYNNVENAWLSWMVNKKYELYTGEETKLPSYIIDDEVVEMNDEQGKVYKNLLKLSKPTLVKLIYDFWRNTNKEGIEQINSSFFRMDEFGRIKLTLANKLRAIISYNVLKNNKPNE